MDNKKEDSWIKHYWRPACAWSYLIICMFDFLLAPILTMLFSWKTGLPYEPWKSITLTEAALYHVAMLGIVGVSSWTRGLEKLKKLDATSENSIDTNNDIVDNNDFIEETNKRIRGKK